MIVVGDASVFIALQRIGEQDMLARVYGQVHVPKAVWQEVFSSVSPDLSGESPPWVVVHTLPEPTAFDPRLKSLDPGEREAILLAVLLAADLLLIDERAGRDVAQVLGLRISGVIGFLLEAKRAGKVATVKPLLDRLRHTGFWLGAAVFSEALRRAGER